MSKIFENIFKASNNLQKIVGTAADTAVELSSKVRDLDLAKNRVQDSLNTNDGIIKLSICADSASSALNNQNLEEAATCISNYLTADSKSVQLLHLLESDGVGYNILPRLTNLREEIASILFNEFDDMISEGNTDGIYRIFCLFPLVGEDKQGIIKIGAFLSSKVFDYMKPKLEDLCKSTSSKQPMIHGDALTELLEYVATLIQNTQSDLKKHYNAGSLFALVKIVQQECDRQASSILADFSQRHRLSCLVQTAQQDITMNSRPKDAGTFSHSLQLFRQYSSLEPVIDELVILNARIELYLNFLRRRFVFEESHEADEVTLPSKAEVQMFFADSKLQKMSHDIIAAYLPMEQIFFIIVIAKAIFMDEVDDATKTSRMIDEAFFLLKKCLRRAISSGNVDAVCALFNHSDAVITDQLINEVLLPRVQAGSNSGWIQQAYSIVHKRAASGTLSSLGLGGSMAAGSSGKPGVGLSTPGDPSSNQFNTARSSTDTQVHFLITLNNLQACLDCVALLIISLTQMIEDIFSLQNRSSLNKLQACLNDFKSSLIDSFRNLLERGFEHLASVLRPHLNSLTYSYSLVSRRLTEEEFDECCVNDPWVESLIVGLQALFKPYIMTFTEKNKERFISLLTNELLLRLERIIQEKSYNWFGALQLDKEMRCLFNYLTSLTDSPLHDKFARLLQIGTLLNLEKIDEVAYYSGMSNWRLTANEIRRFLALRVEFRIEDIRRLKL